MWAGLILQAEPTFMKLNFLICFILFTTVAFPQKVTYKDKLTDSAKFTLDSLLIVGAGSSVTRIFLDELTYKLENTLGSKNITSSYLYLGKTMEEAKKEFAKIPLSNYKTILLILPDTASLFDVEHRDYGGYVGPVPYSIPVTKVFYHQHFNIELYLNDTKLKQIWTASAEVESDPTNSTAASILSTKMLKSFKANKFIH
jgi:hypothetical protein